jgi:hypothetical protein
MHPIFDSVLPAIDRAKPLYFSTFKMRVNFRFLAAVAAISIAACSEPASAPRASSNVTAADRAPAFDYSVGGQFGRQGSDFTLTSKGGSFNVDGLFTLNFPANSVCDPDQSSYGPGEWDKPCVTLGRSKVVQLHAVLQLTATGLAVDFQPGLRFSPNSQVTISTDIFAPLISSNSQYFGAHTNALRPLAIYYAPSLGSSLVADYVSDSSAVTHINLNSGRIWRRIKHFSGWSQTSGGACDPSPEQPDCIEVDQ